jgi:hypothetical protein
MKRSNLLFLCASSLLLAASHGWGADDPAKTGFRGGPRVPANVGFAFNLSPDKQAMTVIFDNLLQEVEPAGKGLRGTLGQTASKAKVFTLEVPYATDQRSVRMAMDLRGYASADADSCVKLIAQAGDSTTVIDVFESTGGGAVKLKGKAKNELQSSSTPGKGKSTDFAKRVEFNVPTHAANPVCQVTLILLAEHDTDTAGSGGGVVMVDSLDLSFASPGQGQYKR